MDLSVVIVTWNNEREIGPCLRSVFEHSAGLSVEIIVIDNASTDATLDVLGRTNGIRTIVNDKNLGFAAATNQGLKESRGDIILLLNSDTVLGLGSLQTMVRYLRQHPEVGVAGGKVLNPDGTLQPSVRRFPALADQAIILSKLYRFFPKLVSRHFCEGFDYSKEQEVDQVRGAYFFITRQLLDKIGPLDAKSYFNWFEEVDYCRRARDAGYKVMYVPSSVTTHIGGASFGQALSLTKQRWFNRSMRNYFRKHGTLLDVSVITVLSPISLLLSYLVQKLKIKPKNYV